MLDPDLYRNVLKKVLSRGGEYADIFLEQKRTTSIHLEDKKVEKVSTGVDSGVGIRLIWEGKSSYAFCNDASEESLTELAETLGKAVKGPSNPLFDLRKARPGTDLVIEKFPDTIPMAAKVDLVHRADRAARSSDSRIKQVSAHYRDFIQRVYIVTSEGIIAEDERVHTLSMVHVIASENGVIQTGHETAGGHIGFELFDSVSVEELSLKASRRALMMLRARRAPGGRMPVVISSDAGGTMIHEAIGHGLEADLAQYGLSVYSHQLGREVASRLVTVIDDATLPHKRGSYRFDDEGTPSQRTVLVDRGILSSYMYDKFTAARDGVASTGNGRRESYRHRPLPRMSNTFIAPGDTTSDEVVKSTPEGLFVKRMGGGQVNTVTGDFVFEVQEGYMIDNGVIGEPVGKPPRRQRTLCS